MTNQDAVSKAISIITSSEFFPVGLTIYPFSRKKDATDKECIVVNTLGFPTDILQIGYANVNIHVADKQGLIDNKRINDLAKIVRDAFIAYSADPDVYIDFEPPFEHVYQGSNNDHYLNMRFKVIMLNN